MYVFRLSNELHSMALSELRSVLVAEEVNFEAVGTIDEFVLIRFLTEGNLNIVIERLALTLEVGRLLAITPCGEAEVPDELLRVIKEALGSRDPAPCLHVDSVRGFGKRIATELVKALQSSLPRKGKECGGHLKISLVAGVGLLYELLYRRRQAKFDEREPHRRPFYMPGTMKPMLARAMVNLARVSVKRKGRVLDPFCGVGGIALEACSMGLSVTCLDLDPRMVQGAQRNLSFYGCATNADVVHGDACLGAFREGSFDAAVTDPPYGVQSSPRGHGMVELLKGFIGAVSRVVKSGGFVVFAVPLNFQTTVRDLVKLSGLAVEEKHYNKVHGSLTRVIYVVRVQ